MYDTINREIFAIIWFLWFLQIKVKFTNFYPQKFHDLQK
jgi:hypothetical protein